MRNPSLPPTAGLSSAPIGRPMEELTSELHEAATHLSCGADNTPLLTTTNRCLQLNFGLMLLFDHYDQIFQVMMGACGVGLEVARGVNIAAWRPAPPDYSFYI